MKLSLTIVLIFFASLLYAQNWKLLPNTKILISNFNRANPNKWYSFVYFKSGNKLMAVEKTCVSKFYNLFISAPKAFDDIFNEPPYKTFKQVNTKAYYFDSSILSIDYDSAIVVTHIEETYGNNALNWSVAVIDWISNGYDPCFIDISFRRKGKTKRKYLQTKLNRCEI